MTYLSRKFNLLRTLFLTLMLVTSPAAIAEDTEIFANETVTGEPNILVVLDNSGSMNAEMSGSATRMDVLSEAFESFVTNPDLAGINIGLMAFSNGDDEPRPHGVSVPVSPIDDKIMPIMLSNLLPPHLKQDTPPNFGYFSLDEDNLPNPSTDQLVRTYLSDVVNDWVATNGVTPIVDSLHEAALYFKGMTPKWGEVSAEQVNAAHPSTYDGQITSVRSTVLTDEKEICIDLADCGTDDINNCEVVFKESACGVGETSCWTGRNCFTEPPETVGAKCTLGSEAACMLSDSRFERCFAHSSRSCTNDREVCTGLEGSGCTTIPGSCTTDNFYQCEYEVQWSYCDREMLECFEREDGKLNTGTASYRSPITKQCQSNTIILMTDGAPNVSEDKQDLAADTRTEVKSLIGAASCAPVDGQEFPIQYDNSGNENTLADGQCGPELVAHLATVDQSSSVDGNNLVKTYTVGFGVDAGGGAENYLKSLATSGGGKYFSANDSAALAQAFISITQDTLKPARSFAAPVYTVDPSSLLSHSKDIYLPLFKNSDLPAWSGNVKKFKLNNKGEIVDANNDVAFDDLGQLKPEAVDFWMPENAEVVADADAITSGGFANNLDPSSRKLLVDKGGNLDKLDAASATKNLLGDASMSDDEQKALIDYITGYEPDGSTPRMAIGDILHGKPTLITYSGDKQVLFFGTNEGFLHAVDAADAKDGGGQELFAFMPESLLGNIQGQLKNEVLPAGGLSRIYGVDGTITAHIDDQNLNGKVDGSDTATLIFGLRRGGSEYYALDVTNPSAPTLKWKITSSGGFSNLGETWSKPLPAKLKYLKGSTVVLANVLVFGGGYDSRLDEEQHSARSSLASTKGNGVYIVDLDTGDLIWSATVQHSVPGNIRTLDMDGDGSIERLYFGDTGGNLWRADLNAKDNESGKKAYDVKNNSQLTHFASLGGGADYRKFFFAPDTSVFKSGGQERVIISIGSGYRSHPLNQSIEDHFYVLSDEDVRAVPAPGKSPLTFSDLIASENVTGGSFLPSAKGWYKKLSKGGGEKVVAAPITFMGKVAFTTFAVNTTAETSYDENGCLVSTSNLASAYVLDLMAGGATADLNGDGIVDDNDESILVPNGDLLDTPQLFFNKPSNCTNEGCDHIVDLRVGKKTTPIIDVGTVDGGNDLGNFLPKVFWLNK